MQCILPIYPGVPEVSYELSGLQLLAIPKSVTLKYPKHTLILLNYPPHQEQGSLALYLCE